MVVKCVSIDNTRNIVLAIRGSQTLRDWSTNVRSKPASPEGFLDDPGNLCHAGFLATAKTMVASTATSLRQALGKAMEIQARRYRANGRSGDVVDGERGRWSLLITGHSAGGAVAALLYMHILAQCQSPGATSELQDVANCFKRVHCVTFGAPPISLLPLQKPPSLCREDSAWRKSIFLSFVNQGDLIARASSEYIRSLVRLYITCAPSPTSPKLTAANLATLSTASSTASLVPENLQGKKFNKRNNKTTSPRLVPRDAVKSTSNLHIDTKPTWPIPPSALSNAGRLILLREAAVPTFSQPQSSSKARAKTNNKKGKNMSTAAADDDVAVAEVKIEAVQITDEDLRGVIWGDTGMHSMDVYRERIEFLAARYGDGYGGYGE